MEKLIPITNKIQDAFTVMGNDTDIDLPQIAVVGSQSAGKSSVLENIVGESFLPRGSGIVTRRPCVIQLHHTEPGTKPYGMFLHDDSGKKFSMEQACHEIDADTARVCGDNKGLDPRPINLRIFSPNVVDLTIIDLPGATRVAVGDQPDDIGQQINEMILSYISKPNCIILAVSAANTDLANSDAILLAKQVDPDGERTLGVLTKLDLMDRGTDARAVFTGESHDVPKLKLGYIGVVNRSMQDIKERKTIKDARDAEMKYFTSSSAYRSLKDRMGTEYLVQKCSEMLLQSIVKSVPVISQQLNEVIQRKTEQLKGLPNDDPKHLRDTVMGMIMDFSDAFKSLIDGKKGRAQLNYKKIVQSSALVGGARIENVFQKVYKPEIEALSVEEDIESVHCLLFNVRGLGGGLFTPERALHTLVRKNIKRFEGPCLGCAQSVYNEMLAVVTDAVEQVAELEGYPNLVAAIQGEVGKIISQQFKVAEENIVNQIRMQLHRINTSHPDFIGRRGVMTLLAEQKEKAISSLYGPSDMGYGDEYDEISMMAPAGPPGVPERRMSETRPDAVWFEQTEWIPMEALFMKKGKNIQSWPKRYLVLQKPCSLLEYHTAEEYQAGGQAKYIYDLSISDIALTEKGFNVTPTDGTQGLIVKQCKGGGDPAQCYKALVNAKHIHAQEQAEEPGLERKQSDSYNSRKGWFKDKGYVKVQPKPPPPRPPLPAAPPPEPTPPPEDLLEVPVADMGNARRRSTRYGQQKAPNMLSLSLEGSLEQYLTDIDTNQLAEINMLIVLTNNYIDIVKRSMVDYMPKVLSLIIVTESMDLVGKKLVAELGQEERLGELMKITDTVKAKKEELEVGLKLLNEANKVLTEDVVRAGSFGI